MKKRWVPKKVPCQLLAAVLGFPGPAVIAMAKPPGKAPKVQVVKPVDKALVLGERMYREGILPSGEPMTALVSGDVPVSGTSFACVSCHLRAGFGSWEGGIPTPAISGTRLLQPRYQKFPNLSPEERRRMKFQAPPLRLAYTDEALAKALREGLDPAGRKLRLTMPRYDLRDEEMAILIRYLKSLSSADSPGVDATTIHLATVVTDEVSREDQQAMLVPMNNYVARHNLIPLGFRNRMSPVVGGSQIGESYRRLSLAVWHLKGTPETWPRQLEAYLAKGPVFALLGGISTRDWKPIHEFCEGHQLPCLFPITDFPVVSDSDYYTQYFSKGYYQEGQAAARYLRSLENPGLSQRVLQIIQEGPEGRELGRGFTETWQELGKEAVKEVRLVKGETLSPDLLQSLLQLEAFTSVLLWTNADSYQAINGLADQAGRPGVVIMSSRQLGSRLYSLPDRARSFTCITFPYRDPAFEPKVSKLADSLLTGLARKNPEARISTRTYSMIQVLRQALVDMDRNLYRDNLLDRIAMQTDQSLPDYFRLSFGPGQRYASKGCFIMQLGPGPEPTLVRKSEWVIH